MITGLEAMLLQGWPRKLLPPEKLREHKITDSTLMDLAGNSFTGPVFGAVLLGVLTYFPVGCLDQPSVEAVGSHTNSM